MKKCIDIFKKFINFAIHTGKNNSYGFNTRKIVHH